MKKYDLIIIGAGPAGLSAAIYAARGNLNVLVVDESSAGGQVKTTHQVANYPGFVEPIPGYQLARNMHEQAKKYGAKFALISEVSKLVLTEEEKWIELDEDEDERYTADYFILATGRSPRSLNIPGEKENKGNGISYCATCDGEFYKDKDIIVVGGGNSAMEESLLLLQYVNSILVVHQFDELQAEKITAEKVISNPKVSFLWSHEPRAIRNVDGKMEMEVENLKTKERHTVVRDGIFIFVGMVPNNSLFKDTALELNEWGYIKTNEHLETNIPGVYAAGDIREKNHWQITTAVADGTIAALEVIKKL